MYPEVFEDVTNNQSDDITNLEVPIVPDFLERNDEEGEAFEVIFCSDFYFF